MKKIIQTLLLLIFISSQQAFSQNLPEKLKEDWAEVVSNLNRRNDLIVSLADLLDKADFKNNATLKTMRLNAENFQKYLDTFQYGKPAVVIEVSNKSAQLVQSHIVVMAETERQPKIKEDQDIRALFMQLEGTENRIMVFINDYNTSCKTFKRNDLIYPVMKTTAPNVKF